MRLFAKKEHQPLRVDIHSHLIPNIDDGAHSIEDSLFLISELASLGFEKLITTPHIHPRYPNTPELIKRGLERVQKGVMEQGLQVEIEAAAEYYVDERFYDKVKSGDPLLSFGDKYVLVESAFLNKPLFFEAALFDLTAQGYKPILAHPERYEFLNGDTSWIEELKSMGVLFQITLGSVGGYYGKDVMRFAERLIEKGLVHFLGSDLHGSRHLPFLSKGLKSRKIQVLIRSNQLKNQELL